LDLVEKTVTVAHEQGLHVRPCGIIVQLANTFKCDITLEKDGIPANGKSILGIMMLAAEHGASIRIICNGVDEEQACKDLSRLISKKFKMENV
jgi:phosphocarrier protein